VSHAVHRSEVSHAVQRSEMSHSVEVEDESCARSSEENCAVYM